MGTRRPGPEDSYGEKYWSSTKPEQSQRKYNPIHSSAVFDFDSSETRPGKRQLKRSSRCPTKICRISRRQRGCGVNRGYRALGKQRGFVGADQGGDRKGFSEDWSRVDARTRGLPEGEGCNHNG